MRAANLLGADDRQISEHACTQGLIIELYVRLKNGLPEYCRTQYGIVVKSSANRSTSASN